LCMALVKGCHEWDKGIQGLVEGFDPETFKPLGISHQESHKTLEEAWERLCYKAKKRFRFEESDVRGGMFPGGRPIEPLSVPAFVAKFANGNAGNGALEAAILLRDRRGEAEAGDKPPAKSPEHRPGYLTPNARKRRKSAEEEAEEMYGELSDAEGVRWKKPKRNRRAGAKAANAKGLAEDLKSFAAAVAGEDAKRKAAAEPTRGGLPGRIPRRTPPLAGRPTADDNNIEALLRGAAEDAAKAQRALHRSREEAATESLRAAERTRKKAADDEAPKLAPRWPKPGLTTAEAKAKAQKKKTQDTLVKAFFAASSEDRDAVMCHLTGKPEGEEGCSAFNPISIEDT
jgi:hypothetical protein